MPNRLLYAIKDHDLYIKIEGAGTAKDYKRLKESVVGILQSPFLHHVEFDLSNASYVDSTFIGLLLQINKILKKAHKDEMEICNVSENLFSILEEIEVAHLFKIREKEEGNLNYHEIPFSIKKDISTDDILEAHSHLTEISEANRRRFSLLSKILKRFKY